MPTRRRLLFGLAAGSAGLAGCGRSLRANSVPGGLELVNRRSAAASVVVRAALRPTDGTRTPRATPAPVEAEEATVKETFAVPANATRFAPEFFPDPGRYVVQATADGASRRLVVELYPTLGGGVGADTVVVRLIPEGLELEATEVD